MLTCALRAGLLISMLSFASLASALEVTITAQYRGGGSGQFENTTPPAGFCRNWPSLCAAGGTVSLPITYDKRSTHLAPDLRDRFFIQTPGRREVEVRHEVTGEPRRMTFAVQAVSQVSVLNSNTHSLLGGFAGGCVSSASIGRPARFIYHTRVTDPQNPTPCWATYSWAPPTQADITQVLEMGIGYELDIPPPYRLRAGIYRGSLTYRVGPGGDFDFGNNVTNLSGDTLTINFELDVQHAFIFEFPPGSERAVLEPKDGWQAWLGGGQAPRRLYRDLPFRLWSTGPFKAYKLCQHNAAGTCGIRNDASHEVPVNVAITLPAGVEQQGRPVQRLSLPTGRAAALTFESAMPTLNRPGQLHFEVARSDVQAMLTHPGSTYAGQVTVVFDADL
ncbi:hypothetical protein [Pseudomonas putida]|uniref:hypothetical protein n=1 Tax=Pseudomonas putida TaxID=303 RepID=UPI00277A0E01|nr:hypothetical protein [Pseudomonas putida]MDP9522193.1 hypothetical protein [Pseudomonas putida]